MKYIVFGVGNEVRLKYSNEFIERIDWFVDNDESKQGKTFCGKKILSPESIFEQKAFVIVSSVFEYESITNQLEARGLKEKEDFVWGPDWYGNEEIPSTYGYKKWKDYDNVIDFSSGRWDYRVEKVASCIEANVKSVMDLGAGAMSLQKYIPAQVEYYPVDYCKRAENTIVCDFEDEQFPEKQVDCIVASGMLEYIANLEWFVEQICNHCNEAVISYISIETMPDFAIRQHEGWKNNLSIVALIRLFGKNKFMPVQEKRCFGNDIIIKFEKTY